MKPQVNLLGRFLALATVFSLATFAVMAGHPGLPQPHSTSYRQASGLFLRFQDALASENWEGALNLCSDRIKARAIEWPTLGKFFHQTVPVTNLLAQNFGCWSCGENAYGLFVDLTLPEETPRIQWHWAIVETNSTWVVDYPPIKLDDFTAKQKKAYAERQETIAKIRSKLEFQMKNLKVQLTAVSEKFEIGSPMLFNVELINFGKEPVEYSNANFYFHPLKVTDAANKELPYISKSAQVGYTVKTIEPGSTAVLAEKTDLCDRYTFTRPGKYFVQFSGTSLDIGQRLSASSARDIFNPEPPLASLDFLRSTTRLPSNILEIEILAADHN